MWRRIDCRRGGMPCDRSTIPRAYCWLCARGVQGEGNKDALVCGGVSIMCKAEIK